MKKLFAIIPILLVACNSKTDSQSELAKVKDSINKVNAESQLRAVRDSLNEAAEFEQSKHKMEETAKRIADSIANAISASMSK